MKTSKERTVKIRSRCVKIGGFNKKKCKYERNQLYKNNYYITKFEKARGGD